MGVRLGSAVLMTPFLRAGAQSKPAPGISQLVVEERHLLPLGFRWSGCHSPNSASDHRPVTLRPVLSDGLPFSSRLFEVSM